MNDELERLREVARAAVAYRQAHTEAYEAARQREEARTQRMLFGDPSEPEPNVDELIGELAALRDTLAARRDDLYRALDRLGQLDPPAT